jgi:hypothetical protein
MKGDLGIGTRDPDTSVSVEHAEPSSVRSYLAASAEY